MIGQKIQHYEIISRLGAGGMGEVFLATDTKLGRKVALKFLPREFATDPERRRRLELEATSASSIDHPNILTIYEINDHDGQPFIAMAYVDGETLKERMARGRLTVEQAVRYGIQIASALGAAHAHGIIHRDVKPDNVLIGKDDRARLTDFGLAKMKETSGLTNRGATVGTVGYMSPEQAQGMPVDARSDVFSLGVILYEMFAGKAPFAAEHAAAALYSIVHETPAPLDQVDQNIPNPIVAVVDRALNKKPDLRYPDGGAVESDMRAVARAMEISRISSGQLPVYRKRSKKQMFWATAGVLTILIGLISALSGDDDSAPGPREAVATENTIAVLNFENLSDPNDSERQGDIIADLLTTDLSASEFVKVVSSQRLYDLAKHSAGNNDGKIERSEAIQIAKKAGATRMLTGSLSKLGGRPIISAQIIDVSTGEVVGAERVDGEDLFAMVDELSLRIKKRVGLSETQALAGDIPVSEATTSNPAAYRAYLQGMEAYHALDWDKAHPYFDKAIELDSAFALAYLRKGIAYFSDGRSDDGFDAMAVTRRFIDRVPTCERFLVQALAVDIGERQDYEGGLRTLKRATAECPTHKEAFFWIANFSAGGFRNEPETTIVYCRRALELDPDYPYALLALSGAYLKKKDYAAAREVAMHYRKARPNDVYPVEMLGDIYLAQGMLDSARQWYLRAIEVAPDQRNGYREIGRIFTLQGQADSAISWYSKTLASDNQFTRQLALRNIASIHRAWGRFEESVGYYRKAATMAEFADLPAQESGAHSSLGWLYMDTWQPDLALDEFKKVSLLDTISPQGEMLQAYALVRLQRPDEARRIIDKVHDEWRDRVDTTQLNSEKSAIEGYIALENKDYQTAYEQFLLTRKSLNDTTTWRGGIAEALIGLGRYQEALHELQQLRIESERNWITTEYLRGLYSEADALVKLGRHKEAVEPLQRLMVFWGNADWEVPWLTDAKRLYSSLTAQ
jgi:serine/threonine protein kinase/tetratricopeptide (TPR) repeat protein